MASLHLELKEGVRAGPVKAAVRARLDERFGIGHVTIEVDEPEDHSGGRPPLFVQAGH